MRRSFVVAAVTAALGLSGLLPAAASEAPEPAAPSSGEQALATVKDLLGPTTTLARRSEQGAHPGRPEVSLAMRDLFAALPQLDPAARRTAQGYLARPTDGSADPLGDGYTVSARKKCRGHLCIHWVPSTADAPPSEAWVGTTLRFMNKTWRTEVRKLGYRKPIGDKHRGGNGKFDVYLKELGSRGIYGYCTPERRAPGHKWLASGYCVLDNDFAEAQFGAPPKHSLRVTAAHEFFHAVQFAYDYAEDPWLMESTATWMEERVADDVNDNRQYLPYGQVGAPGRPLDLFNRQGFNQYGNWTFFEYLSSRFGAGIVKQVWTRAGAFKGAGHQYSTTAVKGALKHHGGFVSAYRGFAAANTVPGRVYPEGKSWPTAPVAATWKLSKVAPRQHARMAIDHLSSRNVLVKPDGAMKDKRWKLRVVVDGPARKTSPTAYVVTRTKHGVDRKTVRLNRQGTGHTMVGFSTTRVRWAKVVLVNASTRYSCWHRTTWSCQGRPRDNNEKFKVVVAAVREKH
ncbi:MAG TPA: MXAN_6640 family putative metalloprotease [Nocardioides sp.]|nr:MXAN_6640 family putative metalloprotease [Nocardioides sp.]